VLLLAAAALYSQRRIPLLLLAPRARAAASEAAYPSASLPVTTRWMTAGWWTSSTEMNRACSLATSGRRRMDSLPDLQ
jgi:hypothetical protein